MYKTSNYNYQIKHEDKFIFFNGMSGKLFTVPATEGKVIEELLNDPISFKIQHESLFEKFKEWGFIIDEGIDEIDMLRYRNRREVFMNKQYHLVIYPTIDCNFGCWYCLQKHYPSCMSEETMEKIKKHVRTMIEKEKITALNIEWFGGEPLLHFDEVIYPLSRYFRELTEQYHLPYHQHITTNASLITPAIIEKFKEIGLSNFQITIDGDREKHNKVRNIMQAPTFDLIMGNIKELCRAYPQVRIDFRLNFDDKTLKKPGIFEVYKELETYHNNIQPAFVRVWQTIKDQTEETKENTKNEELQKLHQYVRELGFFLPSVGTQFSLHKSTHCYADRYYHAEINYDGTVYKCTAQGHAPERIAGILTDNGIIKWKEEVMQRMYSKATFENERCLACKHLPICLGPCSQSILADPENKYSCALEKDDISIEDYIIDLYREQTKRVCQNEKF